MKIFNEQHEMFRAAIRQFIEREIMPHVEEWEAAGRMPRSIWPRLGELGFLGVEYDEKYGGSGADPPPTLVLHGGGARSPPGSFPPARGGPRDIASPPLSWTGGEGLT